MAGRKKTKSKKKGWFQRNRSTRKKKGQRLSWAGPLLIVLLKVSAVLATLVSAGVGIAALDDYVAQGISANGEVIPLELVDVPKWVSDPLKERVYSAAAAQGQGLSIDETAAKKVQENIESLVGWLHNVQVRTLPDRLRVIGQWRKPVGLVELGIQKFYVDADSAVLDYVPLPDLPIVKIKGLSAIAKIPSPGGVCPKDDLAAAVGLLVRLNRMDQMVCPDNSLLREIDYIDLSNYNGRTHPKLPHIVLYTTDQRQIIWGAELGQWPRHLEATDQQKLAKLFGYYKACGTLMNGMKYINLRDPSDTIPLPIDRF